MPIIRTGKKDYAKQSTSKGYIFAAGSEVYLLDDNDRVIGNASLFSINGKFPISMHNVNVAEWENRYAKPGEEYVVIKFLSSLLVGEDMAYPYVMAGVEVPEKMSQLYTKCNYFWDLNKLKPLNSQDAEDYELTREVIHQQLQEVASSEKEATNSVARSILSAENPVINSTSQSLHQTSFTIPKPILAPSVQPLTYQVLPSSSSVAPAGCTSPPPSEPLQCLPLNISNLEEAPNRDAELEAGSRAAEHLVQAECSLSPELLEIEQVTREEQQTIVVHSEEEGDDDDGLYDEMEQPPIAEMGADFEYIHFNAVSYKQTRVRISLDKIEDPVNTARDLDLSHAARISRSLLRYGPVNYISDIAIVVKDVMRIEPRENEMINVPVYIVDGRHRRRAYDTAAKKSKVWKTICAILPVSLWCRIDAKRIGELELLSISTSLNQQTGNIRPLTFKDTICKAVSACKIMTGLNGNGAEVVRHLLTSKALGNLKKRQVQRYAQVGVRFAMKDTIFRKFMELCARCEKISLVHVASDLLLELDDDEFLFALDCLESRSIHNSTGRIESLRRAFYERISELYGTVREAAAAHEKTISEVLGLKVAITGMIEMSVKEFIIRDMVTFNSEVKKEPTTVPSSSERSQSAFKETLKSRISTVLGEDTSGGGNENVCRDMGDENPVLQSEGYMLNGVEIVKVTSVHSTSSQNLEPAAGTETVAAPPSSNVNNSEAVLRRSKRLGTELQQSLGKYRERQGTRVVKRKKKNGNRRNPGRPSKLTRKKEVINALKNFNDEDINFILESLNLRVVRSSENVPVSREMSTAVPEEIEEEEEVEFIPAKSAFNDEVVGLPFEYPTPPTYEGPFYPSWCRYAHIIPIRWPESNPISSVEPWLRLLHLPEGHRSNIVARDVDILRRNHHMVFWRAAYNYFENHSPEDFPVHDSRLNGASGENLQWAAAMFHDDVASTYFWEKKEELNELGYCILQGFVQDHDVPEKIGSFDLATVNMDKNLIKKLREFTSSSFQTTEDLKNGDNRNEWNTIVNEGAENDMRAAQMGVGRYTSTHYAVTKGSEEKESVWACKARSILDIRIGAAISALRLFNNLKEQNMYLYCPKTGGRWLATSEGCGRQQLHTDFPSLSAEDFLSPKCCPGYFTITTGEHEVPVWICKSSHKIIAFGYSSSDFGEVSKVLISPYSILVGRGDLFHAGTAYRDSSVEDNLLRYHMYFIPSNFDLPDGVVLDTSFKPKFIETQATTKKPLEGLSDEVGVVLRKRKLPQHNRPEKVRRLENHDNNSSKESTNNILEEIFGSDNIE